MKLPHGVLGRKEVFENLVGDHEIEPSGRDPEIRDAFDPPDREAFFPRSRHRHLGDVEPEVRAGTIREPAPIPAPVSAAKVEHPSLGLQSHRDLVTKPLPGSAAGPMWASWRLGGPVQVVVGRDVRSTRFRRVGHYGTSTTLPMFCRSAMKRWASPARSNGNASATTGSRMPASSSALSGSSTRPSPSVSCQ